MNTTVKDTKDIYEHIAKVYLDTSRSKKKTSRPKLRWVTLPKIGLSIAVIALIVAPLIVIFQDRVLSSGRVALVLNDSVTKINYDFNHIKKETALFSLQGINLNDFKTLTFRARKTHYKEILHLNVEFISNFNEEARIYVKHIPAKWQEYRIALADFEGISNWSNLKEIVFAVEEWNSQTKKGVLYIDNIRFFK